MYKAKVFWYNEYEDEWSTDYVIVSASSMNDAIDIIQNAFGCSSIKSINIENLYTIRNNIIIFAEEDKKQYVELLDAIKEHM